MVGKISNKVTGFTSLLLLYLIAATAIKCEEKDPEFIIMSFTLPFSVSPSSPNFILGDTLWIEASFSEKLEEFNSKSLYDLRNFDFQSKIGVFKLGNPNLDISSQPSGTDYFNFFPVIGKLQSIGETFSPFTLEYRDKYYYFKLGLVPKQKGVYAISFLSPGELDLRPGLNLGKTSDGRDIIPDYEWLLFTINEDGQTNYELFKKNCKPLSIENPTIPNIYFEQKGTFTFEVK
jgi:hypothetical protein